MKKIVLIAITFISFCIIYSCKDEEEKDTNNHNTNTEVVYPSSELYGTYLLNTNTNYIDFNYNACFDASFQKFSDSCFYMFSYVGVMGHQIKPNRWIFAEMQKRGEYYYELGNESSDPEFNYFIKNRRMKGKFRYDSTSYVYRDGTRPYLPYISRYDFIGIFSSDTNYNDTIGTFYFKQISRDTSYMHK